MSSCAVPAWPDCVREPRPPDASARKAVQARRAPTLLSIHRLVFRTPGLTPAERCFALYVLGRVRRRPRSLNAVDVCKATSIRRDTLPRYARKLEAAGLIRRSHKRPGGPVTYEFVREVERNAV